MGFELRQKRPGFSTARLEHRGTWILDAPLDYEALFESGRIDLQANERGFGLFARKRDFLRTMTPALLTDGLRIEGGI
ncbi:hypothetical protein [Bradyrhizobium sp. 169]|uniref:hypothetical protein n=1 Tax=Bradyrhizobium sp. 169 TaxID=2782640 RepID=UPI001FF872E8|nr:hypothetical protein [Bradyrhizobium sp. 169]MCK1592527.1 hypothetical protein [Bradyrhizobium sp. 169]